MVDTYEDMCSVLPTNLAATIAVSVEAHKREGVNEPNHDFVVVNVNVTVTALFLAGLY